MFYLDVLLTMNKLLVHLSTFFIISLIVLSCTKEKQNESHINTNMTSEIYAGVYDSSFNHFEFQPAFQIPIFWDSQLLYGNGYDSLDLDFNGSFDLFITLSLLNPDSIQLLTGLPNPFPYCNLTTSSEFESAFYSESFPIGLGQSSSVSFVDRFDFNERIDTISDWRNQGKMWQQNPGNIGNPPFGEWMYTTSTFYIGIKQSGDKFGWIEVDASNPEYPKLISYAIQQ